MATYFIAMGQGIIGQGPLMKKKKNADKDEKPYKRKGPNFYVQTSNLTTCTFICGFNSATRQGGAYHYPSGLFSRVPKDDDQLVRDALESWILSLNPTEMTLVGTDHDKREKENKAIREWIEKHNISFNVNFKDAYNNAGITIRGSRKTGKVRFIAGDLVKDKQRHPTEHLPFDMREVEAGFYDLHKPDIELYGKDTYGTEGLSSWDKPKLRSYQSDRVVYNTDSSDDSSESESEDENSGEGGNDDSSKVDKTKATDDPTKEVTK